MGLKVLDAYIVLIVFCRIEYDYVCSSSLLFAMVLKYLPLPKMPLSSICDCIYCVDHVNCVALIVLIVENRSVFAWLCYLPLPKMPSSSIFDRIDCVDRVDCVDCVDRIE